MSEYADKSDADMFDAREFTLIAVGGFTLRMAGGLGLGLADFFNLGLGEVWNIDVDIRDEWRSVPELTDVEYAALYKAVECGPICGLNRSDFLRVLELMRCGSNV